MALNKAHKEKIIEIADEIYRLSRIENHGLDAYILFVCLDSKKGRKS